MANPNPRIDHFGGFWIRLGARVIDLVLVTLALALFEFVLRGSLHRYASPAEEGYWTLLWFVGHWLYFAGLHASEWQGTLGKRALGLRVVDAQGQRISFARATGRFFAEILSSLILLVGYLMVAFTQRKQGLHDMLAETFVVSGHRDHAQALPMSSRREDVRPVFRNDSLGSHISEPVALNQSASPSPSKLKVSHWVLAGFTDRGEVQRWQIHESDFARSGGELVFGRDAQRCDRVIADDTVSGVHGKLRMRGARLDVWDLNSTNGSTVNNVAITSGTWWPLQDGDLLGIGGAELRVFRSNG